MSITTKRGDDGVTDLLLAGRVSKDDARLNAVGDVDELNAALGLARLHVLREDLRGIIVRAQHDLVALMGQLSSGPENADQYAAMGFRALGECEVIRVTAEAAALEAEFPDGFKGWSTPGAAGLHGAAWLEMARTVCRRAERSTMVAYHGQMATDLGPVMRWLNRMSDLLWLAARAEEKRS